MTTTTTASFADQTQSLASQLSDLKSLDQLDDPGRHRLAAQLQALLVVVQPPVLALTALTQSGNPLTCTKMASDMGVFDAFAAAGKDVLTLDDLHARIVRGDKEFLLRILRFLTAPGLFQQVSLNEWKITPFGSSFITNSLPSCMVEHSYEHLRSHSRLVEFMKARNYKNPDDAFNGPWQYAYNTKAHYFGWLDEHDEAQQAFNTLMTFQQQFRGQDWFEFYPVEERFGSLLSSSAEANGEQVVLVDIGGGLGHDALAFRKKFADLPGTVVLQDLPRVINGIKPEILTATKGFKAQAHDMFTPQPIRSAKAYYLRSVLHDWPDKQAIQILRHIHDASTSKSTSTSNGDSNGDQEERSLLLISENVVPEDQVAPTAAVVDFIMMSTCSSLERTERQWCKLIDDAGFRLLRIWKPDADAVQVAPLALFEAVPK